MKHVQDRWLGSVHHWQHTCDRIREFSPFLLTVCSLTLCTTSTSSRYTLMEIRDSYPITSPRSVWCQKEGVRLTRAADTGWAGQLVYISGRSMALPSQWQWKYWPPANTWARNISYCPPASCQSHQIALSGYFTARRISVNIRTPQKCWSQYGKRLSPPEGIAPFFLFKICAQSQTKTLYKTKH